LKEFAFMQALHAHGFPTPVPIDHNRHIVAMNRIDGSPMAQLQAGSMQDSEAVFANCLAILRRLAECGLVHCDFNEFNLMVDAAGKVTLIDFPQMVSTNHVNAEDLFNRDMRGLAKFFAMKMHYVPDEDQILRLENISVVEAHLDEQVRASGFSKEEDNELVGFIMSNERAAAEGEEADEGSSGSDESEDGEEGGEGGGNDAGEEGQVAKGAAGSRKAAAEAGVFQGALSEALKGDGTEAGAEGSDAGSEVSSLDGDEEAEGGADAAAGTTAALGAEELDKAREQARYNLHRRGGGGAGGTKSAPGKKSRNFTKQRNKYGKVVKPEKLDPEW